MQDFNLKYEYDGKIIFDASTGEHLEGEAVRAGRGKEIGKMMTRTVYKPVHQNLMHVVYNYQLMVLMGYLDQVHLF